MSSSDSNTPLPNEIRVKKNAERLKLVYEVFCLFEKEDKVILSGIGLAITQVVEVAEMTKRRMKGLHQLCELGVKKVAVKNPYQMNGRRKQHNAHTNGSTSDSHGKTTDQVKSAPFIRLTLSKSGSGLNKNHVGYQRPLKPQHVNALTIAEVRQEWENCKLNTRHKQNKNFRGGASWSHKKHHLDRDHVDRDHADRDHAGRDRLDRDRVDRDHLNRDRLNRDRLNRDRFGRDRYDRERERERDLNRNRCDRELETEKERTRQKGNEIDRLSRIDPLRREIPNKDRCRIGGQRIDGCFGDDIQVRYRRGKRSHSKRK